MIEIQIHPSDIRRKVRYFFFDRRTVKVGIAFGALLLVFVMASMTAAPSVIRRLYKTSHLRTMRQERAVQAERLREHVAQMSALEKTLEEHRIRVEKLMTVYGLSSSMFNIGQGGAAETSLKDPVPLQLNAAKRRELLLKESLRKLTEQLEMLATYEQQNSELIRHIPAILPVPNDQFVLTSPFGSRVSPFTRRQDFHRGIDLAAPTGTPILSAADGVVTFAGRVPLSQSVAWWRFGNVVVVSHGERFLTIYGHCDTVAVKAGQQVRQGDQIATVGSTGWSTNSHLHYEIRSDLEKGVFEPIDPRIYILNYQWNNEEKLLIRARTSKEYKDFDPLPSAFVGRRRV